MILGGLQKNTLIDFPGKIAATIFTSGCCFRCPWCYASELVVPEKIKGHPKLSQEEFFEFLEDRKGLIEGVVVCGGEPTLQQDLPEFIAKIKGLGYAVKLDTNGSNPEMLQKLIDENLLDYVAMDIKSSKGRYAIAAGKEVDLEKVQQSINILKRGAVEYEFRTTVVPGIHTKDDILKIADWIKGAKRYYLQGFRAQKTISPKFQHTKPYPKEHLSEIQKEISKFFEICETR